jgi:signal transduction histidine kinase
VDLSLLSPALNRIQEWLNALSLYQIVVLCAALIAWAMAADEWRRNDNRDCGRLTLAFGIIGLLRLLATIPLPAPAMPALTPFVESVSLILIFWAFTRSQFENRERSDQATVGLLALIVLAEAATWAAWLLLQDALPWAAYADHWSIVLWYLFQVGLAGTALWLTLSRRNEQRLALAPAFGLVALSNGAALFGFVTLLEPLNGLAYLLWTMATYMMIVSDLRSFGQELRALSEKSLRHLSEQTLLMEISRAAAESLDQSHILQVIADQSGLAFDADRLVLLLSESDEAGRLHVMARYNALEDTRAESLQSHIYLRDALLLKAVFRRKKQLALSRAGAAGANRDLRAVEHLLGMEGLGHAMLEPLIFQEEAIGALIAARSLSRPAFSAEESRLLTTMAALLTSALQNARLYADLKRANQDLTRLNEELRSAYEQLQSVDRLKSSFIGVITHELRSPFASLDLSLQLMRRYGQAGWSAEQIEQYAQLEQGIGRARRMVDSLVSFASLLSRQGALRVARVNFSELVNSTTTALAGMASSREVKIAVQAGVEEPIWVEGDQARLAEAVQHLVHNAIKFNRPGGRVDIRYWADASLLACEVEDTGIGIPPEKLDGIWGQFSQGADPFLRSVEGLGLGLALVKIIIEAHGGRVAAQSVEGTGSSFGFQIPLTQPAK